MGPNPTGTIYNIQALRAFAALAVLFYHFSGTLRLWPVDGAFGVDLFFVISGFIIPQIAENAPDRFLAKRLIRILPFYWAATILYFLVAASMPALRISTQVTAAHLGCSLAFLPCGSHGGILPLLPQGWTLNYELYFYLAFALSLAVSRKFAPMLCGALILGIATCIHFSAIRSNQVQFYGALIVLEFLFGVGVYYLARLGLRWRGERPVLIALIVLSLVLLTVLGVWNFERRWAIAGIPALLLVLGAVLIEKLQGLRIRSRVVMLLGDSSYILYLIHPFCILALVNRGSHGLVTAPVWERWSVLLLLTVIACLVSIALHVWFERPVVAFLRRKLLGSGEPAGFTAGQSVAS